MDDQNNIVQSFVISTSIPEDAQMRYLLAGMLTNTTATLMSQGMDEAKAKALTFSMYAEWVALLSPGGKPSIEFERD